MAIMCVRPPSKHILPPVYETYVDEHDGGVTHYYIIIMIIIALHKSTAPVKRTTQLVVIKFEHLINSLLTRRPRRRLPSEFCLCMPWHNIWAKPRAYVARITGRMHYAVHTKGT